MVALFLLFLGFALLIAGVYALSPAWAGIVSGVLLLSAGVQVAREDEGPR
jgi:hypothetical protein